MYSPTSSTTRQNTTPSSLGLQTVREPRPPPGHQPSRDRYSLMSISRAASPVWRYFSVTVVTGTVVLRQVLQCITVMLAASVAPPAHKRYLRYMRPPWQPYRGAGHAHITGTRAVTRSHKHPTKNDIPLCESHDIPAFLNEMTEDVVTQQGHARTGRLNASELFVCALFESAIPAHHAVTLTPNLSSQFPFLRRNAHTHTRSIPPSCAVPTLRALVPCCCVTTSSVISFKNAGM